MKVILITGCSSGFGMLSAARLAAAGHTVYATMRNLDKKNELLNEVNRRSTEIHLLRLDVTDNVSIVTAIRQVEAEQGRLDILINNAGYGIGGFFEDLTEGEIREQMETNFFGVQNVTRQALPLLRETAVRMDNKGVVKIINVSSTQGRSALPALGAYGASKFALEGFSESLYFELKPFGIRVVLIEPGAYSTKAIRDNTRRAQHAGEADSPYTLYSNLFEQKYKQMLATGVGIGDPEDVAELIEKIVNCSRPHFRYVIGSGAKLRLFAKQLLPFTWFASLISRIIFGKISQR